MENTITSVSSIPTTQISTAAPPRGRISRLKPKEDSYIVEVPNNCTPSSNFITSAYSIVEYDALSDTTAAVKLSQDNPVPALKVEQHQQQPQQNLVIHYPIIDDSKPFVCQQCGLAFSREKAMLSHTKV